VSRPDEQLVQRLVLGFLAKYARGRDRAASHARIAAHLRGLSLDVDVRAVQDATTALRLEGLPVGTSSGSGCFLCVAAVDFRTGYRNLYGRLRTQAKGCRRFKETARAFLSGQRVFDFAEAAGFLGEIEDAPLTAGVALGAERADQANGRSGSPGRA